MTFDAHTCCSPVWLFFAVTSPSSSQFLPRRSPSARASCPKTRA
jgi:hypothetical protein